MFIEIEDLEQEPLHVHHVYPTGDIKFLHEGAVLKESVCTDFVLTHKEKDLHISGSVETALRLQCSRCLKEYVRPLSAEFDLLYLPQPKGAGKQDEIELKYEDMDVGFYDGIQLDVDLMVLEQIELAIPMKLVCREGCKGLCYMCGADLNENPCLCKREEGDPRLATLLDFRRKMEKP